MAISVIHYGNTSAQFIDDFKSNQNEGWAWFTGDGLAEMDFVERDGIASILVDASADTHNVWWALIRRDVSGVLDLGLLTEPGYELRVEARIRVSHAPRRVNLHFNTQRTTDFHSHLMEYDIADTTSWHRISMTTRDFDARPGDAVNVQMALMDWGLDRFRVDIDYVRVDVVWTDGTWPDFGSRVPYHPDLPDPSTFEYRVAPSEAASVDPVHPDSNFAGESCGTTDPAPSVSLAPPARLILLRWDTSPYAGPGTAGPGLLKVVTCRAEIGDAELEELGQVRVSEILGGPRGWESESVTYNFIMSGRSSDEIINPQMIIDLPVSEGPGSVTYFMIPVPVLERLLSGETKGLALRGLGPVWASFYSTGPNQPELLFNLEVP